MLDPIRTHGICADDVEKLAVRTARWMTKAVNDHSMPGICVQRVFTNIP